MVQLTDEILTRLSENKKLYEHPGLGKYSQTTASFIGLHGFWVLLVLSLITTLIFIQTDSHWFFNAVLFEWLYV